MNETNVSDINPAELLAGLYNAVSPSGMGFLQAREGDMSIKEASALLSGEIVEGDYPGLRTDRRLDKPSYFDYLYGRCLKIEINGKNLRPGLYDRDYGKGAAQRVIDTIRARY